MVRSEEAASAAVATPETDRAIARRERERGEKARRERQQEKDCPWSPGSLTAQWWLEGYRGDPAARKIVAAGAKEP